MVCILISSYKFFLSFSNGKRIFRGWGRVLIRVSVDASRVPRREDVLQRYCENSASLLEILRNKIFGLAISGNLQFKCYVCEGFARKVSKITKKTFQSRQGHSLKCCPIYIAFFVRAKNVYPWRKFKCCVETPAPGAYENCNRSFIKKPLSNFSPFAVK